MELIDHIGIFRDMLSEKDCKEYINYFEEVVNSNIGHSFNDEENGEIQNGMEQFPEGIYGRSDRSLFINRINRTLTEKCYDTLEKCYEQYALEYPELKRMNLMTFDVKVQRTEPGGGYHRWHCENSAPHHSHRILVWMIYLNDIPPGEGETEFFTQRLRIQPERGTVVIWPSTYTHVHRGNLVHTTPKYIATGWFVLV